MHTCHSSVLPKMIAMDRQISRIANITVHNRYYLRYSMNPIEYRHARTRGTVVVRCSHYFFAKRNSSKSPPPLYRGVTLAMIVHLSLFILKVNYPFIYSSRVTL